MPLPMDSSAGILWELKSTTLKYPGVFAELIEHPIYGVSWRVGTSDAFERSGSFEEAMTRIVAQLAFPVLIPTKSGRSDLKFDAGIVEDPYIHGYKTGARSLVDEPPAALVEAFKKRWRQGYRDADREVTLKECNSVKILRVTGTWSYPQVKVQDNQGEEPRSQD